MKRSLILAAVIALAIMLAASFSLISCRTQQMDAEDEMAGEEDMMEEEDMDEEEDMMEEDMDDDGMMDEEEDMMEDEEMAAEEDMDEDEMMDEEEDMMEEEDMDDGMMEGYVDLSPEEAKMLIDENPDLIIIDVSPKYDEGHIPGAVNYYIGDGSLDAAIPSLDPEATYLVYCHVDSASIGGAEALVDAGFMNVYRLEGNYAAWVDAGYEVEK